MPPPPCPPPPVVAEEPPVPPVPAEPPAEVAPPPPSSPVVLNVTGLEAEQPLTRTRRPEAKRARMRGAYRRCAPAERRPTPAAVQSVDAMRRGTCTAHATSALSRAPCA